MDHLRHSIKKSDCGVRALAAACGIDYERAEAVLLECGRKVGHWTYRTQLVAAGKLLNRKLTYNASMKGVTVAKLGRELPGGRWIVHVRGHWLAVVDGDVIDWAVGRRFRVKFALKVEG